MPELLLELFSEEIPARMQARAAADLEKAAMKALVDAGFLPEGVKAFAGPRRLTLVAAGLPARQPDRREEKKGPRVGAPDKAVEGFLKSAGLTSLDQCEQREDKKGAYWVAVIDQKGRDTTALIAEFVPEIVRNFGWPKSMRWGDGNFGFGFGEGGYGTSPYGGAEIKWVRPLHSVLCVFDGEIVDTIIGYQGPPGNRVPFKTTDKTYGHRFMAPAPIQARSFDKYAAALQAAKVVLDAEERKEIIARDAATLCKAQGLELVEDAGLLNEVAGLAEWPVAMMGAFDKKFLTVPDEVLTASMRGHQKYFSVRDPKTGRLANKFVYVANVESSDGGKAMRAGYERVLTARLSDAWYLYNQDLKKPLETRIADLDKVTFFEGLGSVGDKARRVAALAKEIAPAVGADPALAERAALLAKADLVSAMVYEFPELQGVMGRYYYLAQSASALRDAGLRPAPQGEGAFVDLHPEEVRRTVSKDRQKKQPLDLSEFEHLRHSTFMLAGDYENRLPELDVADHQQIADAIRDHYKPAGQDDEVPAAPVSVAVALADKIDTLTAFWAIDKKPTGSSDPFALRRAALGIVEIVLVRSIRQKLVPAVRRGYSFVYAQRALREIAGNIEAFCEGCDVESEECLNYAQKKFSLQNVKVLSSQAEKTVDEKLPLEGFLSKFPSNAAWEELVIDFVLFHDDPVKNLLSFFHDRLKVYLRDKGHRHDHIDAVLTDADGNLQDDLVLIVAKLEALEAFLKTDDGANLASAYKRAANILKAEEKKDGKRADPNAVDEKLLKDAEEKALHAALTDAELKAEKAVAAENFAAAMSALARLRAPLDAFFDKVTVNADDAKLRANRLALLSRLTAATAKVADFSKLEG